MVYAYEYFGDFRVPAAMHMGANLLIYLLTSAEIASKIMNVPVCMVCIIWALGGVYLLNREKAIF